MSILFRYLLSEYAKVFGMCFAGLMTIYLVIDFFEKVRRFLRYDARWIDVLTYFTLKTPAISFQIAPLAILMATLLTLGLLMRSHEITAMRACGISLLRITAPFLAFATAIGAILLWFSATVIPLATTAADEIRVVRIEKKPPAAAIKVAQPWIRLGAATLMHLETVGLGGQSLGGIRLFRFEQPFRLAELTEVDDAQYINGTWVSSHSRHRRFSLDGTVTLAEFERQNLTLPLLPEDFSAGLAGDSEAMTLREILAYTSRLYQQGAQSARLLTDYYGRIAFPLVTIIMVLIGIALSLRRSGTRGGSMAIGIGQALAVGFGYWATHSIAIALGRGGVMTPMMAGWTANALFVSLGLYLMLKVRY